MNHPIHWLYSQHIGTLPETSWRCYLCGGFHAEERYPVTKGIAPTFNSHYLCKCPSSPWLCAACYWYFDSRAGHPDFRKMSLMVWETGWKQWERAMMKQDITDTVRGGTTEDLFLVCSLSKKKHILLQAPLNSQGTKLLAIQVEEQVAHIDQSTWQIMNRSFMRLLELGHNKGEILSGNLYANTLRKHGQIKGAMSHSQMLEPYRKSAALDLLSYVTIVEDREELESDRTERNGDPASVPSGVGTVPTSRDHVASGMARPELGHVGQAQEGHLANLRDKSSQRGQDDIQLPLFPE